MLGDRAFLPTSLEELMAFNVAHAAEELQAWPAKLFLNRQNLIRGRP
jgi:hypothetical protein